jgi:integrase
MPNIKITKATMSKIEPAMSGQVDYWDTYLSGFGVRATKDSLTFMVHRRVRGEKNKTFIKIGRYGEFSPEQARTVAKDYIRRMELGENPDPKKKPKIETITVNGLYCQYIAMRKYPLAATTLYQYESWMRNYFPDWRACDAASITGEMVAGRLQDLEENKGKVQAANAIKLLATIYRFGLALHPDKLKGNPVDAVRAIRGRNWSQKERRKTRIADNDLPTWFKTVSEYENPKGRDYLLFLLFTGLRKMEAATLQWSDIDFKSKTFSFTPEKKRGEKPENARVTMPLSKYVHRLLLKRRAMYYENDYIFPGRVAITHITNPAGWVREIKSKTGINFCLHDLRRTYITVAESCDIPHYALKAMLNHSIGNDVTGGYVCMSVDRLREPVQRVTDRILEIAKGSEKIATEDVEMEAAAA